MHNLSVGEVYRITIACRCRNQNGLNIKYFEVSDVGPMGGTVDDLAGAILGWVEVEYPDVMSDQAEVWGVRAVRVFPPLATQPEGVAYADGVPGEQTGDLMSTQTSGLIKLSTGEAGRSNRGRAYIPFPAEVNNTVEGKPDLLYRVGLQEIANRFIALQTITADGLTRGNFGIHKFTTAGSQFKAFSANSVRPDWATQRRRSQINRTDLPPF